MNKLLQFQQKVNSISKDSINPFFKSKYFDINKLIEVIKPILNELELVLVQPLSTVDGKPSIRTVLIDAKDGKELLMSEIVMPENTDPQKMGSTITYFRRYSIQSLLFLQAEDDDGNMTTKNNEIENLKKQVDKINDIEELKKFYLANKGKGKDFDQYVTQRKVEISLKNE